MLAVAALVALAKDHRDSDARRRKDWIDTITYERAQRLEAEKRLDAFRETMKANLDVLERAVTLTEGLLSREGGTTRGRSADR